MVGLAEAHDIARAVAAEASELLRDAQRDVGHIATKSNLRDLVTEWDTRAEDLIRERLEAHTPGIPLLGEERGASGDGHGEWRWLVDPIDGTVNFAHGLPFFTVCISLERAGQPVVGVVYAPVMGWQFHARAGGGAFLGDDPIGVSKVSSLAQAMLASGFPYDRATNDDNNFAQWEHFQRKAGACRRVGCASLDLSMVAAGWIDGYWERRLNPWDVSAGALLVAEAGGTVTHTDGTPFVSASGAAVASNGAIHREILDELAAADAAMGRPR
jgi:myo-inositol-1(or 4)-monophosphatase